MNLSEYLIEAVAKRRTGKYFDFENLDLRSMGYDDIVEALTKSTVPHIPGMYDMIVPSLIGINKNSDALKGLIKAGQEKKFMWSTGTGPKTKFRYLYFYHIESDSRATVWRLTYGNAGLIDCFRTDLPSGKKITDDINKNIDLISGMIKTFAK